MPDYARFLFLQVLFNLSQLFAATLHRRRETFSMYHTM